jgi:hypothetical protein
MFPSNFKIRNWEVMLDWAERRRQGRHSRRMHKGSCRHLSGKISWIRRKTPDKVYHVSVLGLSLELKGWEVTMKPDIDIRLVSEETHSAVLIEVKSSKKPQDVEKDSKKALKQIIKKAFQTFAKVDICSSTVRDDGWNKRTQLKTCVRKGRCTHCVPLH